MGVRGRPLVFANRYRAPPTPTSAVALTRSLFESPVEDVAPVVPLSDFVRLTRTVAANISWSEAKRVRFLPPCAREFPPGIFESPTVTSQMVQTSASEEGTSHPTDDGWAETQRKADMIGNQLTDLGIAVEAIPDRIASDLADLPMSYAVPDVAPVVVARDVECHDSQDVHEQQSQKFAQHFHDHGQDSQFRA